MKQHLEERSDRELMRRVERSAGQRAGYKQLVRELGLGGGRDRRLLLEQLRRLTDQGQLFKIDDTTWAVPSSVSERTARVRETEPEKQDRLQQTTAGFLGKWDRLIAGRIDLHREGYGFVRPNGRSSREDDLFVAPSELHGAMQGDEVLVDEAPQGNDGRRSGRVIRVLTRRNQTVVGTFHYAREKSGGRRTRASQWVGRMLVRGNYVVPFDERLGGPILIAEGDEEPSKRRDQSDRMLGEEAIASRGTWTGLDGPRPLEGMAVDVEITAFPAGEKPPTGRVIEVLGPPDAFGVDVEIVIRKHHLPHVFSTDVLFEASQAAEQTVGNLEEVSRQTAEGRRTEYRETLDREDFRSLPIVTIDGESARDFDDAVFVRDLANGHQELQVHIADVSQYVLPKTAVDLEARLRGTSVYFPDRAVPMLPPVLSSGICSLKPNEDRFVLSCVMEIDSEGEIVQYRLSEGIIRSARRMTYTQVQLILDGASESADAAAVSAREQFNEVAPDVDSMYRLAQRLNKKRGRRGSIDFDLPEPVVQFDPQGNMQAIVHSERGWAHRLIEEFMLSANECVARWIQGQGLPGLYRIHEMPDAKRIVAFEEAALAFGYTLGGGAVPVRRFMVKADRRHATKQGRRHAPRNYETAAKIPVTPQMYQRLAARIAGTPEERMLAFLMLRSLKQARYSETNQGHFALASPSYTHFTSPIRRYPDLVVHRLVRALLRAGANPRGGAIRSTDKQPWELAYEGPHVPATEGGQEKEQRNTHGPVDAAELEAIAVESSQAERRADDAERELIEWKKIKFMEKRSGEEFEATVLSCTKYGFFVELDGLFIEGLVSLASLESLAGWREGERYTFRDTDQTIVGQRSGRVIRFGTHVTVSLDRINRQQRRLQFVVIDVRGKQDVVPTGAGSLRGFKQQTHGDSVLQKRTSGKGRGNGGSRVNKGTRKRRDRSNRTGSG